MSDELPSDPNSNYGADEETARRRREREQDALDAETFGRDGSGVRPLPSGMKHLRDIGLDILAMAGKCSREEAERILATPVEAPRAETEAERLARRERETHERLKKWLAASKIPVRPEMVDRLIRTEHDRTDATRAAAYWMRDVDRRFLVLLGPMGVGKTVASALVALTYARKHRVVRYLREPMLLRLSSSSTLTHEARLEEVLDADLLIVDEVGTTLSNQGEKARNAMFELIDARLASEGRTILMGNVANREALARAYGLRMTDRLREVGRIVELSGESLRGRP